MATRRVELPSTQEQIEITIDWDRLAAALGAKAALSKGGRSADVGGLVVAKHVRPKT